MAVERRLRLVGVGRAALALLVGVAVVAVLAACGSSKDDSSTSSTTSSTASGSASAAKSCKGTPVKVMTIANISNAAGPQQLPELGQAVTAAAAALTKSCELNAPIKVVACDEKFNPNDAAACGRQAVSEKVAVVIPLSGFMDSFFKTITSAGIPIMPGNTAGEGPVTNPLSYPLGTMAAHLAAINLAASTGHKKLALAELDLPALKFVIDLVKRYAKAYGIQIVKMISVPPTASDMSGFAGQVINSGADSFVAAVGSSQQAALFQAVRQQGAGPDKVAFAADLLTLTPKARKVLGSALNGAYLSSWAWDTSDTSKPFINQYVNELKAAGQPSGELDRDTISLTGWAGLHMLADALNSAKLPFTAQNVPKALKQKIVPDLSKKYGINPVDFTQTSQFPDDTALKNLRIPSSSYAAFRADDSGKLVPLSQDWVSVLHKNDLPSGG